jgi:chromosome segregation ATPase
MKTSELEANIERMKENQKLLEKKLVRSNERIRELEEVERNISKLEEENRILGGQVIVLESKEIALRNRGGDDLEERVMEFQSRVEMLLNDKETIANAKNVSIHQMIALKAYIMELNTKLKQLVSENEYSTKKYKSYK